ncbi:MAG: MotA/TolQ/ExbB proton channel family protein [Planctomycetes bacterium]|nr:MotA/TolQ/ExbB proton channel family protein [Planctomycetota bacterium]
MHQHISKSIALVSVAAVALLAPPAIGQEGQSSQSRFDEAAAGILKDLDAARAELGALRQRALEEKLPLSRQVSDLQQQLLAVEAERRGLRTDKNAGAKALGRLGNSIAARKQAVAFLGAQFSEYRRNFESRLHIAELAGYEGLLGEIMAAEDSSDLSQSEVFQQQVRVLEASFDRLDALTGGRTLTGQALDSAGFVKDGTFVVLGPMAYFASEDGLAVGTVSAPPGKLEPTVRTFADLVNTEAAAEVVATGAGMIPFDATLGNAHKMEATRETLIEHVQKGGVIIYPILGMAALAALVAAVKWLMLLFVRTPSRKAMNALMAAVADGDAESARRRVKELRGPAGKMLAAGVASLGRSRDLIEEVMYERLLVTKSKLQAALPFIAICAASAPLLGLLGTVTGIINTFKQITLFGSGDVKQLSGGISEALITTKFGLVVAIPSLLLHAYLSRKARSITTKMESAAVRFANEVAMSDEFGPAAAATGDRGGPATPDAIRGEVTRVLSDMLGPVQEPATRAAAEPEDDAAPSADTAAPELAS